MWWKTLCNLFGGGTMEARLSQIELALVHLIRRVNEMNSHVTELVTQVTANVAAESNAASALSALVSQVATLNAALVAAQANSFSPEDVAALDKAMNDLSASAKVLVAATPVAPAPAPVPAPAV